jgi:serine/threonine-protein kinase
VGLAGGKLGNYELLAEVARGSTTDLILARATGMGGFERHVVMKRVREERLGDAQFVEAFLTEARLAGTLHHHNIVQVQDIAQDGNVPFFAMEYVHGEDLRALLAHVHKAGTWVPIQHVLTIGLAVAAALHHAHEQRTPDGKPLNIVHRDVTPSNILVGYDGNVKVGDFGMAKAAITSVTQVGTRKGKAPYMAPEQCAGQRVDRRTDVFALGIVLHELATARRLFKGANDHDTMTMIVHGSIPPPLTVRDDLPRELSTVIMKALARLPADRYQSAAELAGALETYASAAGIAPSTTALAAYLKQQLGERKEPWLPGGSVRPVSPVDFDGAEPGVASPAGEAVPPARTPTMPAAIAQASQPMVPGDHDDNEQTATGGPSETNAEEAFAAEATKPKAAEPKKLDINAFAPKKLEAKAPRKDATPIPSLVKKATPPPDPAAPEKPLDVTPSRKLAATTPSKSAKVALTDLAAGWETKVDQNAPSRAKELDAKVVDDEMKSESSTAELTPDQIETNLATVGLASRPAPQPVARVALVKKVVKTPPPQPKIPDEDLAIPLEPPPPRGDEVATEKLGPEAMRLAREEKERAQAAGKAPKKRATIITSETSPVAGGEVIVAPAKVPTGDSTELVAPLPLDLASAAELAAPKPRRKRTMLLAGIGGVAVFAAVALFVAFSGGSSQASQAATATASNDSEARPLAKHADDDKEATGGQLTWNGVLDAGGGSAEPAKQDPPKEEPPPPEPPKEEPPPPEPPKEEPPPPEPPKPEPVKVIEPPPPPPAPKAHPVAKKPPPPKPHPVAKKPPPKKTTTTTKPDKTVKYDPNSLFLGK